MYSIVSSAYGKTNVKLLHIRREGALHSIQELEVNTHLTLSTQKDYLQGDNSDIVATDSQKNTVYILAKKHGVKDPESFALLLSNHFLTTYGHVTKVRVYIEQHPWKRMTIDGKPHNHAFISEPSTTRFCTVSQERNGKLVVESGINDLRVLKTTQSAFVNFINDEYRSLPDAHDRVFSTIVYAKWEYSNLNNLDFDAAWNTVKNAILDNFAGPPDTGVFSPSVQHTLYLTEKTALDKVPQMKQIEIVLPNKHYVNVDLSKFPKVGSAHNDEVLQPLEKPSGNIRAALARTPASKL